MATVTGLLKKFSTSYLMTKPLYCKPILLKRNC